MQKSYGPIYDAEEGCGPRSRRFVVTRQEAIENERRINLRVLVRLHADASEHKVWQWRNFLLNPKNKMTLTPHRVCGKGVETG